MKLSKLQVKNYRGLRDVTIPLSPFVCLTGENNSGKSSVLQALSLLLSGSALKPTDYFDPQSPVTIEVTLSEVVEEDLRLLAEEHRGRIAELVHDKTFALVRRYGTDGKSQLGYFGRVPKETRFSADNVAALVKGKKGAGIKNAVLGVFPELDSQAPSMTSQEAAKQAIQKLAESIPDAQRETRFVPLPTGLDKSVVPMLPERIYIPAVKDLADETKTAETSSFGKVLAIVMKAIEPLLADEKGLFDKLSRKLTRTLASDGTVEDNRLKEVKDIEESIQAYVRESFAGVSLEIDIPPPELKTILSTARIIADDGVKGPLELKGDGLRRAVVFSILRTYVAFARSATKGDNAGVAGERGYLLLFEEPELFLHPDGQKILFGALGVFSKKNHVVVTTHSPLFLGPEATATFVRLSKDRSLGMATPCTKAHPVDLTGIDPKDEFQIVCFENNSAALFARRVVLVEGDSDYIVFPHVAETLNSEWDCRSRSVAFVRVGGKGSIARYRKFFGRFGVPVFVIADLDALMVDFDKLEPNDVAKALREELLRQADRQVSAAEAGSAVKTDDVKRAQGSRDIRSLWGAVREARSAYDRDKSKLPDLDAAVETFFAWEKKHARYDCIRDASEGKVEAVKTALISELRRRGVFVLERGSLEDYYPCEVTGPDKPSKARRFRALLTTRSQMEGLCGSFRCPRTAKDICELECICSAAFGACELPCTPDAPAEAKLDGAER